LFYLIFVHLFALSRQASYRLPFAIDRRIDMIHPKLLRLTSLDICKYLYSCIGGGKGGREEGRLKAEMRMKGRLRRSWRGVKMQPQNQPTAWFMGFCVTRADAEVAEAGLRKPRW
jgi:hypothetical protein